MKSILKLFILCILLTTHSLCWSNSTHAVALYLSNTSLTDAWTGENGGDVKCSYAYSTGGTESAYWPIIPPNSVNIGYKFMTIDTSHHSGYIRELDCIFYNSRTGAQAGLIFFFNSNGNYQNPDNSDYQYYYQCHYAQPGVDCDHCEAFGTFTDTLSPISSTVTWNSKATHITGLGAAQGETMVNNLANKLKSILDNVDSVVGHYNASEQEFTLAIEGPDTCHGATCTNPYDTHSSTCAAL